MYKLATNLKIQKEPTGDRVFQPQTNKGIRIGPELKKHLPAIFGSTATAINSGEILLQEIIRKELITRGIIIPIETNDLDHYFSSLCPLKQVSRGFFDSKPSTIGDLPPKSKIAFLGVPSDIGAAKPGCRFGPEILRDASHKTIFRGGLVSLDSNRSFSPAEISIDLGNLSTQRLSLEEQLQKLEAIYQKLPKKVVPFMVGGDHTFTLPAVKGLSKKYSDLTLVQFDSHMDLQVWGEFEEGSPKNLDSAIHSNFVSHLKKSIPTLNVHQIGVKNFQTIPKDQIDQATEYLSRIGSQITDLSVNRIDMSALKERLPQKKDVYLTIDVDVLRAGDLEHTGYPNATGIPFTKLLELSKHIIETNNIVGIDIMEFGQSNRREDHRKEAEMVTVLILSLLESLEQKI